jgi:hypothetical protein
MPQDKITKVPDFEEGHSYIVIMNNSKQLGIWHKGEILKPDPNKSRFINSMQLGKGERAASDDIAVHPQVVEKWIIGNE